MFIPDVYKDVSYVLDDDSYASAEYNDVVRKRFIKAWEGLVEGYKVCRCLPPSSCLVVIHHDRIGHFHGEQLPAVLWSRI